MTKPQDLLALAQAAIHYTQAVTHTQHCKELLRGGYIAWREYQHLRNAKSRERRAQQKLLALAKHWEGVQ